MMIIIMIDYYLLEEQNPTILALFTFSEFEAMRIIIKTINLILKKEDGRYWHVYYN